MESPKETVGLLGGSFNPVHIGHMMLAQYLTEWKYVDKVWLTLSPLNPLKESSGLIPDMKRLAMLTLATKNATDIEPCDIELSMPRPSYTIDTLDLLSRRHKNKRFKLVIGSDNWRIFDKWRDYQRILDEYGVLVFERPGYPIDSMYVDGLEIVANPTVNISSTFIRNAIARGRDVSCFLPYGVYKYICDNRLYPSITTKK